MRISAPPEVTFSHPEDFTTSEFGSQHHRFEVLTSRPQRQLGRKRAVSPKLPRIEALCLNHMSWFPTPLQHRTSLTSNRCQNHATLKSRRFPSSEHNVYS